MPTPKQDIYNQSQLTKGNLTWSMITELGRLWQQTNGLEADGFIGPQTQASIEAAIAPVIPAPGFAWDAWDGPLEKQPATRSQVYLMFGNPGAGAADPAWVKANIREFQGADALPGIPPKWYFKIHKLVEPYAREGLRRAQISSTYEIERAGCYVFRHQRFDPRRPLSYHSFGIAIDFDAGRNAAKTFTKDTLPKPWSPEWLAIWPRGVDRAFVDAMASCGWSWGGWWNKPDAGGKIFVDPQHAEFVGNAPV